MNSSVYQNTIRLCIRAGKYSYGDRLIDDIRAQRVYLVLVASDAGEASAKKVKDKCNSFDVKCLTLFLKSEYAMLFKKNISSFGVTDKNLAQKLLLNLNKGGFYYEK